MKKKKVALLMGMVLTATTVFSGVGASSARKALQKSGVQAAETVSQAAEVTTVGTMTTTGGAVITTPDAVITTPDAVVTTKDAVESEDTVDMSKLLDMNELYGWATVPGEGLKTVTGGGNAKPVVVTTTEELEAAVGDNVPRVVIVDGTIRCVNSGGSGIAVGNNKTIVGADKDATLYGGFRIHNQSNIIISNLNLQGAWPEPRTPDDCLEIKGSHHIWLNHLNIWNSFDGNVDITLGSDYITVSWCKMWYTPETDDSVDPEQDHRLSCLVGSGAGDHDDTDMGKLRITYHHNWFAERLDQRMPRVMYGRVHVYNNYYTCENNTYCIGADSYASVLIENNYFKNVKNPHEFSYNPGLPASITARGNEYDNTTGTRTTGQHYANSIVQPFETTVYDYFLNDATVIPDVVQAYAGPQDLSDEAAVPENLKTGAMVEGVEEEEDVVLPSVSPLPTQKPVNTLNDNPITYDEETDTYTYNGQNSDGSHAYYTLENPYKNYDFSETPSFENGYPVWTKGATISYWVKVPKNAVDAAVLNFNLENDRQMNRNDEVKYNMCKNYSETNKLYSMGVQKTYVDASGSEYTVLEGYGPNVLYNPNYPTEGCYYADSIGGAIYACEKGADPTVESNWKYLNYIGEGLYESYGVRFDEEGGHKSKIQEGLVSGSFSLYASGSMGYRQDNWHGLQMNPYLKSYGQTFDAQQYNQCYYWGNGGYHTLDDDWLTPTMEEKGEWHFVVVVIKNDWVQFYMDGIEMEVDYLEWWGQPINRNTGSKSFNLGYGNAKCYRTQNPSPADSVGMTILDFISDEDTVLTVGGLGAGATRLGQEKAGTPDGTQVKNIEYYFEPIAKEFIKEDRIVLNGEEEQPSESPSQPPSDNPSDEYILGDVNHDGEINLGDAQKVLKVALKIEDLSSEEAKKAADVDASGKIELLDAQLVLKKALRIIESFK